MLGSGFARFFQAYSVNAAGSAVSAGALPLIALLALDVSPIQVSLLAAVAAAATAALSLPIGGYVDRSDKRRVMMTSNLVGFASLATVPIAAGLGLLTYTHLCLVAVAQTTVTIASVSAGSAYLKTLVPKRSLTVANARLDTVNWLSQSAGPPAGGALVGLAGPTATVLVDACSYLASALLLRRARPAPPQTGSGRVDVLAGWRWIWRHRGLRLLYLNAMIFGGAVMWASPLMAVRLLKDLHAAPWQYGLALGVPCLGGLAGAILSPRAATWLGSHRALLLLGLLRTPWLIALPFLDNIYTVMVCDFLLLGAAGLFNPLFATFRMTATPDALMGRVVAGWSLGSKAVQPLFMVVGGVVAAIWSTRTSLLCAGVMCLFSAVCLPRIWRGHIEGFAVDEPAADDGAMPPTVSVNG